MPADPAPPEIQHLAALRAEARRARDWEAADRLRLEIEAAGWRVVDAATLWTLERASAPTVADGELVRYGSSAAVPSRLEEAPLGTATVVLVADGAGDEAVHAVASIGAHVPDGTQVVVVANGLAPAEAPALRRLDAIDPGFPGLVTEVLWTSVPLGYPAALNAGIRRAAAPVVVLLDPARRPAEDVVPALVHALSDPSVAVAGATGLVSTDLRRFDAAPPDQRDVVAVEADAMAFRRADYRAAGPLDEHFGRSVHFAAWWSLVLRDAAVDGAPDDAPARRAVQVPGLTADRPDPAVPVAVDDRTADADRRAKKDFYRFLKRFASRRDLLVAEDRVAS